MVVERQRTEVLQPSQSSNPRDCQRYRPAGKFVIQSDIAHPDACRHASGIPNICQGIRRVELPYAESHFGSYAHSD